MHKQYLNIAITGLSSIQSEELKTQLRNLIPSRYKINWSSATDPTIDCLFIHEKFYDAVGIQKLIHSRAVPWLKISSHLHTQDLLAENILALPILNHESFSNWLIYNVFNPTQQQPLVASHHPTPAYNLEYFSKMLDKEHYSKLHLFDDLGTIAIIDIQQNIAWLNPTRQKIGTTSGFNYDIASTSDFMKVSRKHPYILNYWLWQFFWDSPEFLHTFAPEDGHFKIHMWPKPPQSEARKVIFQLSSCFIQGAKISTLATQLNIPTAMVQRFIAANLASANLSKINLWDNHYHPQKDAQITEDSGFIKSFFGKLRKKLGL